VAKNGARSYFVGFYDHEGSQRTRSFPAARAARDWMEDYVSAERRGRDSLRRFLLDLDAREANAANEARTIGEVVQLYFAFNAPDTADGLATSTFRTYSWSANRHLLGHEGASRGRRMPPAKYAVRLASEPAERFNHAAAPRALRDAMRRERVGQSARAHAWRVLSAVLSWAAQSELVPEIQTNGCLLANEKVGNRRKSVRGQQGRRSVRRRGEEIRSWALAPMAVELIRADMLARAMGARRPLIAYRDATLVSIQLGLGLRNQEVYGMRWSALERERAHIVEVLSWNQLDEWGKTEHATGRAPKVPALLREDLAWWRERLPSGGTQPAESTSSFPAISPARSSVSATENRRVPHERQPGPKVGAPVPDAGRQLGGRKPRRIRHPARRDTICAQTGRDLDETAKRRRAVSR
jgi:integrase